MTTVKPWIGSVCMLRPENVRSKVSSEKRVEIIGFAGNIVQYKLSPSPSNSDVFQSNKKAFASTWMVDLAHHKTVATLPSKTHRRLPTSDPRRD